MSSSIRNDALDVLLAEQAAANIGSDGSPPITAASKSINTFVQFDDVVHGSVSMSDVVSVGGLWRAANGAMIRRNALQKPMLKPTSLALNQVYM